MATASIAMDAGQQPWHNPLVSIMRYSPVANVLLRNQEGDMIGATGKPMRNRHATTDREGTLNARKIITK
jgi:hypothetical protein